MIMILMKFPGELCNDVRDNFIIQICSGITRGRVLNGEHYAQRLQKLIYLLLSTDCFMKISLQSTGPVGSRRLKRNFHETVCRQLQIISVFGKIVLNFGGDHADSPNRVSGQYCKSTNFGVLLAYIWRIACFR